METRAEQAAVAEHATGADQAAGVVAGTMAEQATGHLAGLGSLVKLAIDAKHFLLYVRYHLLADAVEEARHLWAGRLRLVCLDWDCHLV